MRRATKTNPTATRAARRRVTRPAAYGAKPLMTVHDVLRNTELDSLDAELLLGAAWKRPRSWLLAHPEAPVPPAAYRRFALLAERRGTGEPIAYLTGRKEFYGREFEVNEDVLCPRPDTEALVERALEALTPGDIVFDVGTGSGCVGITIAAERPDVSVVLTDVSAAALRIARRNARRLRVRVRAIRVYGLPAEASSVAPGRLVVVANLPYLDGSDLPPEFEPSLALDGGSDGLRVIRELLGQLRERGTKPRHLLLEHGQCQGQAVRGLAGPRARTSLDLAGNERVTGY